MEFTREMPGIGFIGTGVMGKVMAENNSRPDIQVPSVT